MRFVGEPRFENERLVGFIGSSVDIQYHKDAEEQLRQADQRKDEFLAILGHELRNPLSPISGAAQVLQFVKCDRQASFVGKGNHYQAGRPYDPPG